MFTLTNLALFACLPFAYLLCESEGFIGNVVCVGGGGEGIGLRAKQRRSKGTKPKKMVYLMSFIKYHTCKG